MTGTGSLLELEWFLRLRSLNLQHTEVVVIEYRESLDHIGHGDASVLDQEQVFAVFMRLPPPLGLRALGSLLNGSGRLPERFATNTGATLPFGRWTFRPPVRAEAVGCTMLRTHSQNGNSG